MTFHDLTRLPLEEQIAHEASRKGLWIFQHLPKTAGTSLTDEFDRHLPPYYNIHVDYEDRLLPFEARLSNAVDRFLAHQATEPVQVVSGHLTHDLVERIRDSRPDARVVTFLRDPVERVISDYRYQCSALHPGHEDFRARFPRIEDYIEAPGATDKMAMMIWGSYAFPTEKALRDRLGRSFAFVGLLEMYVFSFQAMFAMMGLPGLQPQAHARKTPQDRATEVEVTPALRARIAAANPMDRMLYDHVHAVLTRQRDGWWS